MNGRPTTICPSCGQGDPQTAEMDFGIGAYDYAGAPGFHRDIHTVTVCCEAEAEEFWPEPSEEPQAVQLEVGQLVVVIATGRTGTLTEVTREGGRTEYMVELGDIELGFARSEIGPVK